MKLKQTKPRAPPIHKRCKRPFLLLEVFIAFTLLALCLFPLLKPLIFMRKSEREKLMSYPLEREARKAYCEVREHIFEQKFFSVKELEKGIHGEWGKGWHYTVSKIEDVNKKSNNERTTYFDLTLTHNRQKTFSFPLLIKVKES